MISKKRLLAGLREIEYVEEGMVTVLANFSKVIVDKAAGFDAEAKEGMKKILSRLYKDSSRHREMARELILKVEKSVKDVF
jgi:hypothetical protein